MTFNLDTVLAEAKHEPFTFTLDGSERELPHIQTLTAEQAVGIDGGNTIQVLHEIAGDELGERLGKLPAFALEELLKQWLSHAGLKPGESPASTRS